MVIRHTDKIKKCIAIREGKQRIKTIELHTAGEPLRVIYDGIEDIA